MAGCAELTSGASSMPSDLHSTRQCEKELEAWPGFSWQGVPKTFACSCGRIWKFMNSEADGAWWDMAGFVEAQQPEEAAPVERPVWLEIKPNPEVVGEYRPGMDCATLRDVLITESHGPGEPPVRTGQRVRRITLDLPLDAEGVATIEMEGTDGNPRTVALGAYDWRIAGFAHWPDGVRRPGGSHLLLRILEGLEPGVPKPDLDAEQAQLAADTLARYAESLRKRGINL